MSDEAPQTLTEALEAEVKIGEEAAAIRSEHVFADDGKALDAELFLKLWPLLCRPIQPAFIQSVAATKGKPYPSTGIRSVQVQVDRMNNVLTPIWWWYEDEYALEGKLCTVTVYVGDGPRGYLLARSSRGGVQQGSSVGNIHKGSFTNAAKLAFARLGVGHEVYIGATDLDPDVSHEVANAAEVTGEAAGMIGKELAKKLVDHAWEAGEKDRLRLAASKLAERDVGDCSTKAKATDALTSALTFGQAERLDKWLLERKGASGGGA